MLIVLLRFDVVIVRMSFQEAFADSDDEEKSREAKECVKQAA